MRACLRDILRDNPLRNEPLFGSFCDARQMPEFSFATTSVAVSVEAAGHEARCEHRLAIGGHEQLGRAGRPHDPILCTEPCLGGEGHISACGMRNEDEEEHKRCSRVRKLFMLVSNSLVGHSLFLEIYRKPSCLNCQEAQLLSLKLN